jgi:hypothetical protein
MDLELLRRALGRRAIAALAVAAFAGAGCQRDEVTHTRVPKVEEPREAAPALPPGHPPLDASGPGAGELSSSHASGSAEASGDGSLKWRLPKGWTSERGSGMRFATIKPSTPGDGKVEVTVVMLQGPAGGELANVNRWRGQIGLAPIDEPARAAARQALATKAGQVSLYDFTSEGEVKSRMVAVLLSSGDGNTWFVKMSGDAPRVAAARADFIRLLESLHFD